MQCIINYVAWFINNVLGKQRVTWQVVSKTHCICNWPVFTLGTEFMVKLHKQLIYFVNMKITHDKLWQGVKIYLSGHEVLNCLECKT